MHARSGLNAPTLLPEKYASHLCVFLFLRYYLLAFLFKVSAGVNGPIFHELGKKARHKDVQVVDAFRNGGDLVGVLSCTGNGTSLDKVDAQGIEKRIAALTKDSKTSSMKTLKGLRVDPHADKLLGIVQADAKLGRMSKPVRMTPAVFLQQDNDSRCYSKAFTVEQGQLIF